MAYLRREKQIRSLLALLLDGHTERRSQRERERERERRRGLYKQVNKTVKAPQRRNKGRGDFGSVNWSNVKGTLLANRGLPCHHVKNIFGRLSRATDRLSI